TGGIDKHPPIGRRARLSEVRNESNGGEREEYRERQGRQRRGWHRSPVSMPFSPPVSAFSHAMSIFIITCIPAAWNSGTSQGNEVMRRRCLGSGKRGVRNLSLLMIQNRRNLKVNATELI